MRSPAARRIPRTSRFVLAGLFALVWTCLSPAALFAQGATKKATGGAADKSRLAAPEDLPLKTADGKKLKLTYFKARIGREAPVVLMIHGKGGNRQAYGKLATELQEADYAVITLDLAGHGESESRVKNPGGGGKKSDAAPLTAPFYQAILFNDMEAVKHFIYEEHQKQALNMNKLAIIAADVYTPVAMAYTEIDWKKPPFDDAPTPDQCTPRGQDVRALVLLSPEMTAAGIQVNQVALFLRELDLPISLIVGKDSKQRSETKNLHRTLAPSYADKEKPKPSMDKNKDHNKGKAKDKDKDGDKDGEKEPPPAMRRLPGEKVEVHEYDANLRGTSLIGDQLQGRVQLNIKDFLDRYLRHADGRWQDRRSRAERDE